MTTPSQESVAAGDELVLTPPEPVPPIAVEQVSTMVPVSSDTRRELSERAASYVGSLERLDPRSPEFAAKIGDIATLGDGDMRSSSHIANRMLGRSVAALAGAKGDSGDAQQWVAKGLVELRRTIEDLDPKDAGRLTGRKLISKLPFGNNVRDFVARYQSANVNINRIITSLRHGQDELRRDNAAIQNERANLWNVMGKLQEYAVLAQALDHALETRINELDLTDTEKANALRADALFPVRQKNQDLLTQLAVCAQGYLALDVIRRNNVELVKGVERAASTTVAALRVAVTIAQALANQKMVIEQVNALRGTTEEIIATNAEMLASQSAEIQKIAADPAVSAETLRKSFESIYRTIDTIDAYKAQAVTNMGATVDALRTELERASTYLERSQRRNELEES